MRIIKIKNASSFSETVTSLTCQNQTCCRHCASADSLHICPVVGFAWCCKCIEYKKNSHEAWLLDCEVRQQQNCQIQAAYETCSQFYLVLLKESTPKPVQQYGNVMDTFSLADMTMYNNEAKIAMQQKIHYPLRLIIMPMSLLCSCFKKLRDQQSL